MRFVLSFILLFAIGVRAQDTWTGEYQNVADGRSNIEMFSTNGCHFIMKSTRVYAGIDENPTVYSNGLIVENNVAYDLSGPFESYGYEGDFFEKDGNQYYYAGFHQMMSGEDSLSCLFKKTRELPNNWKLTAEEREGETGILAQNLSYIIGKIEDVEYSTDPILKGKIIVKLENERSILLDRSAAHNYKAFQEPFKISDLFGKVFKFFFIQQDGYLPGYMSDVDKEKMLRNTPYEIIEAQNIGAKLPEEPMPYPNQWTHDELSEQFHLIVYAEYNDQETMDLHMRILSPSNDLLDTIHLSMGIMGETSVFERVSCESHITNKGILNAYDKWTSTIIVTDFNFDGLHDLAVMNDEGGSAGAHYSYYIQVAPATFKLNKTLTEKMSFLPTGLNLRENTIECVYPVGVDGVNEIILRYDKSLEDWVVLKDEYRRLD